MSPHGRDAFSTDAGQGRAARRAPFARETDLAQRVIEYLHAEQWTVWQEVGMGGGAPCCDIVARRGPAVWAIECKLRASLEVLDQASRWIGFANLVSVAVPKPRGVNLYRRVVRTFGVGVLWVGDYVDHEPGPFVRVHRNRSPWSLAKYLTEERRLWPAQAGTNRGGQYTEFGRFCRSVRELVEKNPGASTKQIIDDIDEHHYSNDKTARACLLSWARAGKVPGVEVRDEGRAVRLYPTSANVGGECRSEH